MREAIQARLLRTEGVQEPMRDVSDLAFSLDLNHAGMLVGLSGVIVEQPFCLSMIQRQSAAHDILPVIIPLDQWLTGHIVSVVDLRRVEDQMIEASGGEMDTAPRQPPDTSASSSMISVI